MKKVLSHALIPVSFCTGARGKQPLETEEPSCLSLAGPPACPLLSNALDNLGVFYYSEQQSFLSLHCFCEVFGHCEKATEEKEEASSLVPALSAMDEASTSPLQLSPPHLNPRLKSVGKTSERTH